MSRPFNEKSFRDKESEHHLADLDSKTAIRTVTGKALKDLFDLVNSAGFLDGETYDGFLCEETLVTKFKTFHFFLQGEEVFQIGLGFNSDLDIGALKSTPSTEITRTFFVQGLNLGNEIAGSVMGVVFAIGGNNIVYSILQDESGLYELANGNQLVSIVPIPEGVYELVIKAEGTGGTQYVDKITIHVFATALISNINLTNLTIEENSGIGSTVGALSTAGGESPITYSILQQQQSGLDVDIFEISNNLLITKDNVSADGTNYQIILAAEDSRTALPDDERIKVEEFTIDVVASSFVNTTSLTFNGIDEYVRVSDHASLNAPTEYTYSAWVKVTDFAGGRYFVTKWESAGNQRALACIINSGGFVQVTISPDGATSEVVSASQAISLNTWTHIVCQFKSEECRIFLDGIDRTSAPTVATTSINTSTADLILGAFSSASPSTMIEGLMDEIAVYDKFLTPSEISSIYGAGAPTNLALYSSAPNLISWWRMGDLLTGSILPDQIGVNDATIVNMNNGNKSTDVPI